MLMQLHLLHFFLLFLPPAATYSTPISKPGCLDRCGNLSIPYPFGVGSDCSLDPSFNIACTHINPSRPNRLRASIKIRSKISLQVVEINDLQIRGRWLSLLNTACYNSSGHLLNSTRGNVYLKGTPFTLSEENWLTAIGCDDMVLGVGQGNITIGGCASLCTSGRANEGIGFCADSPYSPGNGCCRSPIPRGLDYLGAKFIDISKERSEKRLFRCSYAFLQEKSGESNYSYPLTYLNSNKAFMNYRSKKASRRPVFRLDWRIGAENCLEAQRNPSYACRGNSTCVDVHFDGGIQGYRCRCMQGYEGNPYLTQGCQDIDECDPNNPCHPNSKCINTPGSFKCSCPKGYYGDGLLNGTNCIKLPTTKDVNLEIGLGSGIGIPLLLTICFSMHKKFRKRNENMRKERFFKKNGGLLLQQKTNEGTIRKTRHFLAKELEKATDHFNESRIIGQGGQGTVYKGMLSCGKIVAVKKSKAVDKDQLEQFINEVVILSQVDHRNVVKLLGCCLETEVPLLVYEFVPNGTLFDLIHDPKTHFPFSWDMRLKIAADMAGALAYLHSASSIHIYHRDIKSSNMLLDEKYIVKVADFGISRSVAADRTHLTTKVKGTFGYFDPEYFQSHKYTEKSDVYSFGVVLAELLTGNMPIFYDESEEMQKSLASHFLTSMDGNMLDAILDPQVSKDVRKEEVIAVARLAQRCLNSKKDLRPAMKDVATKLEGLKISSTPENSFKDEFEESFYEASCSMEFSDDIPSALTTSCISEIVTTTTEIPK